MPCDDFPTTLPEFERRFRDEVACGDYLRSVKWPEGFRCPKCGGGRSYWVCERGREQCATCRHQTSVTSGTMFHKIRDVFVRPAREQLAGIVEADETYVGAPEPGCFGRARGENKLLIAGAVEVRGKGCRRSLLRPVDDAGAEQLQTFVADVVKEGAVVRTDGLKSYRGLDAIYKHKAQVIGKDDPSRAAKLFPNIHRVFALFKRVLLGTYHGSWSRKWAALYCEEFAFRFNRRNSSSRTHLFRRVVEQAVTRRPRIHLLAQRTCEDYVVAAEDRYPHQAMQNKALQTFVWVATPIGLDEDRGRSCDVGARRLLGRRGSCSACRSRWPRARTSPQASVETESAHESPGFARRWTPSLRGIEDCAPMDTMSQGRRTMAKVVARRLAPTR